ncbi:MAG: response regulator [Alphaproteobacteria bacterium]|nr:response regulator [Alphaproteobacteria bacterium]
MARILVIEDDALFAALMRRALEKRGHYVVVSTTAQDGRDSLRREEFDALVSDIVLPGDSGLNVLRDARANAELALIAISGSNAGADKARLDVLQLAHSIGVDAIVRKPFELSSFVTTVEGAIAKTRNTPSVASA